MNKGVIIYMKEMKRRVSFDESLCLERRPIVDTVDLLDLNKENKHFSWK